MIFAFSHPISIITDGETIYTKTEYKNKHVSRPLLPPFVFLRFFKSIFIFVSFQLQLVLKDVSDVKTYSEASELHYVRFHESFVITRGAYLSEQENKK